MSTEINKPLLTPFYSVSYVQVNFSFYLNILKTYYT